MNMPAEKSFAIEGSDPVEHPIGLADLLLRHPFIII
jgi:hypothetical protein